MTEATNTPGNHATTPAWILDLVRKVGPIRLDPCSNPQSIVGAGVAWEGGPDDDGLKRPWGEGLAYVNPPYGRGHMLTWARRITDQARKGCEVVALTPCDPSTKWFRELRTYASEAVALDERPVFGGHSDGAKKPHMIWYFGERRDRFRVAFERAGTFIEVEGWAVRASLDHLREVGAT